MSASKTPGGCRHLSGAEKQEVKEAVENGDRSTVLHYLDTGWNVNEPLDDCSTTALHLCSDPEIGRILCDRGADVNARDSFGQTPLHYAAQRGDNRMVDFITGLQQTLVDVRDIDGFTPLHLASLCGQTETVQLLITKGSDARAVNELGWTPLHDAAQYGHPDVIDVLIQHQVSLEVRDQWGQTPLHYAAQEGYPDVIDVLIRHQVSLEVRDKDGNTPLHLASKHGRLAAVEILLKKSVDATIVNKNGETAYDVCGNQRNVFFAKVTEESINKIKDIFENHKKLTPEKQQLSSSEKAKAEDTPSADPALQVGRSVAHYLSSAGTPIPKGWVDINIRAQGGDESELGILSVDVRLSDYFPVTTSRQPPPQRSCGPAFDFNKETMTVHFHTSLSKAFSSVALIVGQRGTGSGFRVGPDYVMTNWHVAEKLAAEHRNNAVLFYYDKSQWLGLESVAGASVHSLVAYNEDLDVAVLKLDIDAPLPPSVSGCKKLDSLPPPLTRFKKLDKETQLHFAGHPDGKNKVADIQCCVVQMEPSNFRKKHDELKQWSQDRFGFDVFPKLDDEHRALYKTSSSFGNGSSGCPGFVPDDQQEASVAVMQAFIFPSVPPFHTVSIDEITARSVEQGIRMEAIHDFLHGSNERLCKEIFLNGRPR